MTTHIGRRNTCAARIATLGIALIAFSATAQNNGSNNQQALPRYAVIDLGTLGGTYSNAYGINNNGWVTGMSTLPGDTEVHTFLWRNGVMHDLGTLGGENSYAGFSPNQEGDLGGLAETSTPDPLGENYCGSGTICLPLVWHNGVKTPLPTLGGSNGAAQGMNARGVVPGVAENTTPDPACNAPQVLQGRPVLWEPVLAVAIPPKGAIHELPVYPGDTEGAAHMINDKGQATGWSGTCAKTALGFANFHALVWENGRAIYLGSLGGTLNTQGLGINNRGQVAGYGDLAGDTTFHAFLWQDGVMSDLGTLPGDMASGADGLNNLGQVVGGSWDASWNGRAVIWQDGVVTDLNTLIPPDSPLYLLEAQGTINDFGWIAGYAWVISTGEVHAFLATPTREIWPVNESQKVVLPDNVRNLLQQHRRFGGPGGWPIGPH
jgi:probable HAF family extracellular repeat protein